MEYSKEEIQRQFVAMGHSVALINDIIAGKVYAQEPRAIISNNQDHLETMMAKDIWAGYDLTAINAAIAIDSETVPITPYREQGVPLSDLIGNEVERRIFSHASANTQMNMTGAATAGLLTSEQMDAYKQGLLWVASMRSKGAELIANNTEDYFDDKHWPEPSAAAVALANAF